MVILFILSFLLGALVVTFSLQNIETVTVSFFNWEITSSLAVILLLSALVGMLIVVLFIIPERVRNYFSFRKLRKENESLQEELRKQKELTTFAKNTPPTREDISNIENGAIDDGNES